METELNEKRKERERERAEREKHLCRKYKSVRELKHKIFFVACTIVYVHTYVHYLIWLTVENWLICVVFGGVYAFISWCRLFGLLRLLLYDVFFRLSKGNKSVHATAFVKRQNNAIFTFNNGTWSEKNPHEHTHIENYSIFVFVEKWREIKQTKQRIYLYYAHVLPRADDNDNATAKKNEELIQIYLPT